MTAEQVRWLVLSQEEVQIIERTRVRPVRVEAPAHPPKPSELVTVPDYHSGWRGRVQRLAVRAGLMSEPTRTRVRSKLEQ